MGSGFVVDSCLASPCPTTQNLLGIKLVVLAIFHCIEPSIHKFLLSAQGERQKSDPRTMAAILPNTAHDDAETKGCCSNPVSCLESASRRPFYFLHICTIHISQCHPRIKLQSRRETGDTGRTNLSCCHLQLCLEYLESSESCFKADVPAIQSTGGIQGFASGQFRADRRTIQAKTKVIRTGSRRCAPARNP